MFKRAKLILTTFLFAFIFLLITSQSASASAPGDGKFRASKVNSLNEIAAQLETRKQTYLQKNNVTDIHSLPQGELYSLLLDSQEIKKINSDVYQRIVTQQEALYKDPLATQDRATWNWAGKIFLTMDSTTLIFNHGHAGIASTTQDDIIEANRSTGVTKVIGNNYRYWDRKRCRRKYHGIPGGVYGVLNTSWNQHLSAVNFATNQIGKRYSVLNDGDLTFYCSELVYRAWQSAGKTISYSNPLWGYMVLPADLMLSPDTYIVEDWSSWNNSSFPNGNSCPNQN